MVPLRSRRICCGYSRSRFRAFQPRSFREYEKQVTKYSVRCGTHPLHVVASITSALFSSLPEFLCLHPYSVNTCSTPSGTRITSEIRTSNRKGEEPIPVHALTNVMVHRTVVVTDQCSYEPELCLQRHQRQFLNWKQRVQNLVGQHGDLRGYVL